MNARTLKFSISILAVAISQRAMAQGAPVVPDRAATTSQTTAPLDSTTIPDIIVTAQKRSERLNDVPMSISAITGDQLAQRGVTQVSDLEKVVPGFTFQASDYGSPVYSLRGIGFYDIAVAVPPAVGVYVDQVPLPYSAMTEGASLDVARVEALKGPQGTLFGQNSTGGAINFIANKPTAAFQAGASVSYGNYNAVSANGFLSGPIAPGLTARFAVNTDQRDGWQRSETRDAKVGRRNFLDGRFLVDWNPATNLRFELNLNGWRDKSDTQAAQFVAYSPGGPNNNDLGPALNVYKPAPKDNQIADWDRGFSFLRDDYFYQASLRADWDVSPSVTATSISAYSYLRKNSPIDPDGTNQDVFRIVLDTRIKSYSQELRISGNAIDGKLKWLVGGNYEYDKSQDHQPGYDNGTNSGIGPLRFHYFNIINDQVVNRYAVFGSLDYALTSTLTASVSTRYTKSDNRFSGCTKDTGRGDIAAVFSLFTLQPIAPGTCVTFDPATHLSVPSVLLTLNQDNVSWRAGLSWKPDRATMIYANVTKGYKAGSFPTVPGLIPSQFAPVPQESLLAYEIGFKKSLFDRSLQLNGAAFYYDYTDKQIQGYVSTAFGKLPSLVSIPKSSVKGFELDATLRPSAALTITGGLTYVDSKVDKSFLAYTPFETLIDIKGEEFPNTPRWQLNGDFQYDFPLATGVQGYVGASARYRSGTYGQFGRDPIFRIDSYGILDLRAGLQSENGRWRAEVWGRNVTDKFHVVNITRVIDTIARITGMPATYGVTLSYKF